MDKEILDTLMELDIPDNILDIVLNVYELVMADSDDDIIRINVYENAGASSKEAFIEMITGNRPKEQIDKVMGKMKLLKLAGINFDDTTGLVVIDKVKARKRLAMLQSFVNKE